MIDLIGISPFLRIALWVAMATMHFHIAQTDLFVRNIFCIKGGSWNNLAHTKNCPGRARYVKLHVGVKGTLI